MVAVAWQCLSSLPEAHRPHHGSRRGRGDHGRWHGAETADGGGGVLHLYRAQSRLHPQRWGALPLWGAHQHRVCRVDRQPSHQQALLQTPADAMDHARRAPPVANAGENPESGTRGAVPALVSRSAAGGKASGGVTPRFLMLSEKWADTQRLKARETRPTNLVMIDTGGEFTKPRFLRRCQSY